MSRLLLIWGLLLLFFGPIGAHLVADDAPPTAPSFANSKMTRWRIGGEVTGQGGVVTGVMLTTALPTDWPEQAVKITEEKPVGGAKITVRKVEGGSKQLVITVPRLTGTDRAAATVICEVSKSQIVAPAKTAELSAPKSPAKELQPYLAPSPGIESTNPKIKDLAAKLADPGKNGWQQAEALYDGARSRVKYEEGPFKGALAALNDGTGDCEELTSLVVALCRASKIPARAVWVPRHCYAEFYLEDAAGKGAWYPCQPAGGKVFGSMKEDRIILQKGDNFRLPEHDKPQHYLQNTVKGNAVKNAANPQFKFIFEQVQD